MAPPYNREGSPEKLDSEQQLEKRAAENAGPEAATAPAVAEVFNAKGGVKQKFDLAVEVRKSEFVLLIRMIVPEALFSRLSKGKICTTLKKVRFALMIG